MFADPLPNNNLLAWNNEAPDREALTKENIVGFSLPDPVSKSADLKLVDLL